MTDYGMVSERATVSGKARIIEYAHATGRNRISGTATLRGRAVSWDDREVSGTAVLDGDDADALNVRRGVWFHWFVNDQKKVDAAADLNGLYAQYDFSKTHPFLAWDTHGAAHGLLVGKPEIRPGEGLCLDGRTQYVEPRRDLRPAGRDSGMAVRPWDLGLRCGFLGRGLDGGFFKGYLAEVSFFNIPKEETGK